MQQQPVMHCQKKLIIHIIYSVGKCILYPGTNICIVCRQLLPSHHVFTIWFTYSIMMPLSINLKLGLHHLLFRLLLTSKSQVISERFWSLESTHQILSRPWFWSTSTFVVSSVHQLLVPLQDSLAKQQKKTFSGAVALVSGADYKGWIMDNYCKLWPDNFPHMQCACVTDKEDRSTLYSV